MKRWMAGFSVTCLALALTVPLGAESTRIEILSRQLVLDGRSFGLAGSYELVQATVHFAIDPENPANQTIVDLALAPKDADGRVSFSADLRVLRPADPARGNGTLLLVIANRGSRGLPLSRVSREAGPVAADDAASFGDGFLLEQGFTVAWVGWQFDVLPPGVRLVAPVARDNGRPVTGQVIHRFRPGTLQASAALPTPYAAVDPEGPGHVLRESDPFAGGAIEIPRDRWRFARVESGTIVPDLSSVYLEGGFQPGRQYELIFTSVDPPLSGLGFASVRDLVSHAKSGHDPLFRTERAIGMGGSQSGRFLREFVKLGFNADEEGRQVFDGLIPFIAGAGGGYFNYRFAQPGQVPSTAPLDAPYPADRFPFADLPQLDPFTDREAGLLDRARAAGAVPKTFYLNASSEYDDRGGALVHVWADGSRDATLPETTRVYTALGAPHGGSGDPQAAPDRTAYSNPNGWDWLGRALVVAMHKWVTDGTEPPASRYPKLADSTLVPYDELDFPAIPGIVRPARAYMVQAYDFGPDDEDGIVRFPPRVLGEYPLFVPAVDRDGNERGGVRMPEVEVPLATYSGWNTVRTSSGVALAPLSGSYIPFPADRAAREATGDPRLSVAERYASRAEYLGRYAEATMKLVREGLILPEDFAAVMEIAERRWAFHETRPGTTPSTGRR